IWKFTFTDATHAAQAPFGPAFPGSPVDLRHPNGITLDLLDPTSNGVLLLAGGQGGGNPSVVLINGDTEVSVIATEGDVIYGNGIAMGEGYYGPNTIFVAGIAAGDPSEPGYNPAKMVALNRETGEQHVLSGQDPYLSLPSFMSIFHTDGGTGYAGARALN